MHGCFTETHHKMHYGVILADTDVWTCPEDEPVPVVRRDKGGILWVLFGAAIGTPAIGIEFVGIGVGFLIMKRVPQCRNDHGVYVSNRRGYTFGNGILRGNREILFRDIRNFISNSTTTYP
jgi:hypothetical protein